MIYNQLVKYLFLLLYFYNWIFINLISYQKYNWPKGQTPGFLSQQHKIKDLFQSLPPSFTPMDNSDVVFKDAIFLCYHHHYAAILLGSNEIVM